MLEITLGIILVLLVALGGLIFWLSRARTKTVKAEAQADALRESSIRRQHADKIMAEPVADESDWVRRQRERMHDGVGPT